MHDLDDYPPPLELRFQVLNDRHDAVDLGMPGVCHEEYSGTVRERHTWYANYTAFAVAV